MNLLSSLYFQDYSSGSPLGSSDIHYQSLFTCSKGCGLLSGEQSGNCFRAKIREDFSPLLIFPKALNVKSLWSAQKTFLKAPPMQWQTQFQLQHFLWGVGAVFQAAISQEVWLKSHHDSSVVLDRPQGTAQGDVSPDTGKLEMWTILDDSILSPFMMTLLWRSPPLLLWKLSSRSAKWTNLPLAWLLLFYISMLTRATQVTWRGLPPVHWSPVL